MISVAGTLVADLIVRPIRAWPGKNQNAIVDHIEVLPGGAVANTGMALARLGVPVSTCAAVGEDNLGKIVKDSINRWAILDGITVIPSRRTTASVVAVSEDGDRCFLSAPGACDQFSLTPEQVENEIASGSRALHIGYALILPGLDGEPLKKVMRRASQLGALTSLDVTYFDDRPWPDLLKLMPEIDVFCPSLLEASAITGKSNAAEAAAALVEAGVRKFVAVTEGARGALIDVVGKGQEFIPAHPVKVIDTTGAGDAFIAGVLAAWYRGLPWRTAAQIGALVASIAVTGSTRYENLRSLEEHAAELVRNGDPPKDPLLPGNVPHRTAIEGTDPLVSSNLGDSQVCAELSGGSSRFRRDSAGLPHDI
jgi:sugar/nucleoside kinase (ribokinase family)